MTMTVRADTSATTVCLWLDVRAMNLYGVIMAFAETMTSLWKGNENKNSGNAGGKVAYLCQTIIVSV